VAAIKRSFRRLSLQVHPDKSSDPAARSRFDELTKAYEVLSSPTTREAYNLFLDDPESFYAFYYGIRAVYPSQTNPVTVLVAVLLFLSLGQYLNTSWTYQRCLNNITRSDQFTKAVKHQIASDYGDLWKRMTLSEQKSAMAESERTILKERVLVDGMAPRPLDWTHLAIVQFCLLPINVGRWLFREVRWFCLFTILRREYGPDEETQLTRSALGFNAAKWDRLGEVRQAELIKRKLWIASNCALYLKEENEKEREQRLCNGKYKQWKRWKKKNTDTTYMLED